MTAGRRRETRLRNVLVVEPMEERRIGRPVPKQCSWVGLRL